MDIRQRVAEAMPPCDRWTLRLVDERSAGLRISRGVLEAPSNREDRGIMLTVQAEGGVGYAATPDLSDSGLRSAAHRALDQARLAGRHPLFDPASIAWPTSTGSWNAPIEQDWNEVSVADKVALLQDAARPFTDIAELVDWMAVLEYRQTTTRLASSDGLDTVQERAFLWPMLIAIATEGGDTLMRSNGRHSAVQSGVEALGSLDLRATGERMARELRELIAAPLCPTGTRDLILASDHMILQIHESIGHPLELDRILGDERNFAGGTFVKPEMVGSYQYGSDLLNVTFDPSRPTQIASYGFDDQGTPATREYLIRNGILERALGGIESQARSGLPGVACSRSTSWRRPPIDRMANLNLEPGTDSLDDLVRRVETGILMETTRSWSIDDVRDKFQFGTEYARLIENGELGEVVRKPNYRGRSASFWRRLAGVGDGSTFHVHGTPFCGKGEPSQIIPVGHASPAALFTDVDVFGGV